MHERKTLLNIGRIFTLLIYILFCTLSDTVAQQVPSSQENIPYLVTFGKNSKTSWGDDDFCQIFFFIIPKEEKKPIFIRVFDPDIGNSIDEIKEKPDSKTKFSILGGKGAFSNHDSLTEQPIGKYDSGTLLASKTFDNQSQYDNKWYTFGPFNPAEGEYLEQYGGYIIKIIAEGVSGNDGNLYKYFLSTDPAENIEVEGSNNMTYEYTFRLNDEPGNVSHIYPFVSKQVVSIKIHTFDFDNDGISRIISVAKQSEIIKVSGEDQWAESLHLITEKEKNTSLDIQMIKRNAVKDNNVVFYITNQYGSMMPFYTSPIGGVPRFVHTIKARPQR